MRQPAASSKLHPFDTDLGEQTSADVVQRAMQTAERPGSTGGLQWMWTEAVWTQRRGSGGRTLEAVLSVCWMDELDTARRLRAGSLCVRDGVKSR